MLPEVREIDAPPDIATIYADIKEASGTPQINLIYRHLATLPGVLDWTWNTVGPLYRSGHLADAVSRLDVEMPVMEFPPVCVGRPKISAEPVQNILAFYNHSNRQNLIALTAMRIAFAGEAQRFATEEPASAVSAMHARGLTQHTNHLPQIPPLPKRADLPDDIIRLVDELANGHSASSSNATPSLYLHMALWPDAMSDIHAGILPLLLNGTITRNADLVVAAAEGVSRAMPIEMQERPGDLVPLHADQALQTITGFATGMIPEMIVIGRILTARV